MTVALRRVLPKFKYVFVVPAEELCRRRNIPVVARFPFSRAVAEAYASGIPPYLVDEAWRSAMDALWAELKERSR